MDVLKTRKALGERLRAFRRKKGLSMYKVAKNGNIAIGQVRAVENGDTNYTVNILLGYLSGCGLKVKFRDENIVLH